MTKTVPMEATPAMLEAAYNVNAYIGCEVREPMDVLREQINAAIEAAPARVSFSATESLCAWLLHRFGPDSPEGREAAVALAAIEAAPKVPDVPLERAPEATQLAALNAPTGAVEWIAVGDERKPRERDWIWTSYADGELILVRHWGTFDADVTHWQPITKPNPPKGDV